VGSLVSCGARLTSRSAEVGGQGDSQFKGGSEGFRDSSHSYRGVPWSRRCKTPKEQVDPIASCSVDDFLGWRGAPESCGALGVRG
jgi:hypothetical protein